MSRRLGPVDPAAYTAEQQRLATRANAGPRTRLGAPLSVMLHSPGVADPLEQLSEYVRFRSNIPKRIKELVILIVARHWGAPYPWSRHYEAALAEGIDAGAAAQIARGEEPASLAADERLVYRYCNTLLRSGRIDEETVTGLRAAYGTAGLVDLVGLMSYYFTVSMVLAVDNHSVPDGNFPKLSPVDAK